MKVKKLFILLITIFVFSIVFPVRVVAANGQTYLNDAQTHNFTTKQVVNKEIGPGTTYVKDEGYTTRSNTKFDQDVHILMQKSNVSEGSKVVSWGIYNDNHSVSSAFGRDSLEDIALDYEKNHPGWKVVGGINADQYFTLFGTSLHTDGSDYFYNQPYYGMMSDGENWFTIDALGRTGCNVTGFKNDGSTSPLVWNASNTAAFKLSVYDSNNNLLGKYDINDLNPKTKISDEYTYVYTLVNTSGSNKEADAPKSVNVTASDSNSLYIVSNADKAWASNSVEYSWYKGNNGVNAFFGKGTIDKVESSATLNATSFAIETTNQTLLSQIKQGCYVVAQYEYTDSNLQNCETAIGWHTMQRFEGVDQNVGNSYNSRGYPRSVFGVTSDGTICLITVDGKNSTPVHGMYAEEVNALCKAYDIKTAFQMDGGGSVTMVARDDEGQLVTINAPAEGSPRNIFSGLFFVVKDVESTIEVSEITQNSLEFTVSVKDENVSNLYLQLTGKTKTGLDVNETKEVIDGKVKFEGLDSNTEYSYNLQYKLDGSDSIKKSIAKSKISTAKIAPSITKLALSYNKDGKLQVNLSVYDPDKAINGFIFVSFDGGKSKQYTSSTTLVPKNFEGDPISDIVVSFTYNLNDNAGRKNYEESNMDMEYDLNVFLDSIVYKVNDSFASCFISEE